MEKGAELGKDLISTSLIYDRLLLNILRCDVTSEILGAWLAPDGSYTKTVAELKDPAIEW